MPRPSTGDQTSPEGRAGGRTGQGSDSKAIVYIGLRIPRRLEMGDVRFQAPYERVRSASDRPEALRALQDEDLIAALAAASQEGDPYLVNVLATEAQNRVRLKGSIVDAAAEGLGVVDREGLVTFLNPAGARLLGYATSDLLGRNFHDAVHAQDFDGRRVPWEECPVRRVVLGKGEAWHGESTFTRSDGTTFPGAYTAAPIRRDGEILGAVLVFRDITDVREAQRRLEESEQRYRSLMEHNLDAIYSMDRTGRFVQANPALERLSGYSQEELLAGAFDPLVAPEDLPATREHFERAAQGKPQRYYSTLLKKDGTRARVLVTNIPIYVQGRIVGVYGIAKDVTGRLRDAEQLQYLASLLQALNEATPDGVVVVDLEGKLLYHNERFRELWQLPPGALDGDMLRAWVRERVMPDDAGFTQARSIAEVERTADTLRLHDGRILDCQGARVRGPDGAPYGWVWRFRDVTEETRARERYQAHLKEGAERYRRLYDTLPFMCFATDLEGRVRHANRYGAEFLGYKQEELEGVEVFHLAHPDDREEFRARITAFAASDDATIHLRFRKLKKTGEVVWVKETTSRVTDPSGEPRLFSVCDPIEAPKDAPKNLAHQ